MMNVLLVLALLCQDGNLSLTGKAKREDKEFELTVNGKGKALQDQETVTLRFRRLANRLNWSDGALVTEPAGDEVRRVVQVDQQAFEYAEHFPAVGEVEVLVGLGGPEGAEPETSLAHRVFRVATLTEMAHAIGNDAAGADVALRGLGMVLEDLEALRREPAASVKKQARLQKRVDWRKNTYRQETARSCLTASGQAVALWMDDVEHASELERTGKDLSGMISSLTGKLFSWEDARNQLSGIEAVSLRERALLVVREIGDVGREVAAAVAAGDARAWAHHEKEFTRALEVLRETDGKFRAGALGGRYASLVDLNSGTLAELIGQAAEYLQAAATCVHCAPSSSSDFDELGRALMDRAGAFEVRIRTQP